MRKNKIARKYLMANEDYWNFVHGNGLKCINVDTYSIESAIIFHSTIGYTCRKDNVHRDTRTPFTYQDLNIV